MTFYSNNSNNKYCVDMIYKYEIESVNDLRRLCSKYGVTTSEFESEIIEDSFEEQIRHRRNKDSWKSSDVLYTDIDDGWSIQNFEESFKDYEYYIQTSKSHTVSFNKYHAFFPLREKTFDKEYYSELQYKLNKIVLKDYADKSTSDITKYLSASPSTIVKYNSGDKTIDDLLDRMKMPQFSSSKKRKTFDKSQHSVILNLLKDVNWDDEYEWWKLGVSLKNSGFEFEDWVYLSWDSVDEKDMQYKWDRFKSNENLNQNWLLRKLNI